MTARMTNLRVRGNQSVVTSCIEEHTTPFWLASTGQRLQTAWMARGVVCAWRRVNALADQPRKMACFSAENGKPDRCVDLRIFVKRLHLVFELDALLFVTED